MLISITLICKDKAEAKKIAKALLDKKLIACANIADVDSLYWWKDDIVKEREAMMILKTMSEKKDEALEEIKRLHSYEVVSLTVEEVETTEECLQWVRDVVSSPP